MSAWGGNLLPLLYILADSFISLQNKKIYMLDLTKIVASPSLEDFLARKLIGMAA